MSTEVGLAVAGLALSVGFGVGAMVQGYRNRVHGDHLTRSVEAGLRNELRRMRRAVLGPAGAIGGDEEAARRLQASVAFADVLNSGETFLVTVTWAGVHGSLLKVFGWRLDDFEEVASQGCGTPESFTVGDLDGDGLVEIANVEADWNRLNPATGRTYSYAEGARRELLWRWNGSEFAVVDEHELPMPGEGPRDYLWHVDPIEVPQLTFPNRPGRWAGLHPSRFRQSISAAIGSVRRLK